MKTSILIIAALIGCVLSAPIQTSPSICDAAAQGLGVNDITLMNTVVTNTVNAVVADNILKKYFDGTIPGTVNFTDPANAGKLQTLKDHLAQFFGLSVLLNCTDGTVPSYAGNPDMVAVHKNLPIDLTASNQFNTLLLQKTGLAGGDADRVRVMLSSVRYQICNTGATCNPGSICDLYSIALNLTNDQLLGVVVDGTVGKVTTDSLKKFFDGTISGTTNFLDPNNKAKLDILKLHLRQFFGQKGVLECTDGSVGAYQGLSMKDAHAKLPITLADFNTFNNDLLAVMKDNGVAQADLDATNKILQTTKGDICNQAGCNPAVKVIFSAFLLFAALLVTLF